MVPMRQQSARIEPRRPPATLVAATTAAKLNAREATKKSGERHSASKVNVLSRRRGGGDCACKALELDVLRLRATYTKTQECGVCGRHKDYQMRRHLGKPIKVTQSIWGIAPVLRRRLANYLGSCRSLKAWTCPSSP